MNTLKTIAAAAMIGASAATPAALADNNAPGSAYRFSFTTIDEKETIDLAAYRGKAVLVVNTASFCGFTPQYSGLQTLWSRYRDSGLVVLGVPSNDFGGQEPKSESDIQSFCQGAFNVTFPLTIKYHVRGADAHPFYKWVAEATDDAGVPKWNFHKILIGPDGTLRGWFASAVEPMSPEVVNAVEAALPSAGASGGS